MPAPPASMSAPCAAPGGLPSMQPVAPANDGMDRSNVLPHEAPFKRMSKTPAAMMAGNLHMGFETTSQRNHDVD
jgi:hypothetical protein